MTGRLRTGNSVTSNVVHTAATNGSDKRFASPGVRSDSCATIGMRHTHAPTTTGNAAYPPFENTTEGLSLAISAIACTMPTAIHKRSATLRHDQYRRSFPD